MRNVNFWLISILVIALAGIAGAQDATPITTLTFMHAPDGAEYVEVEQEVWKPIHAQRIRDGEINAWVLYEIVRTNMPGEANYLTIEVYPNWAATEDPFADIAKVFEEVHGANSMEYMSDRTSEARSIVDQRFWSWQFGTDSEHSMGDVQYVVVDWMDVAPGKRGEYLDMEREYYLPAHQRRVDAGNILSWGLWTRMDYSEVPGSIDAATSANFKDYASMWQSFPQSAWTDAHGDLNTDALYQDMLKTRKMVGTTVFRVVDFVNEQTVAGK